MPKLALLCDFPEENWPSMRVAADGLDDGLRLLQPEIVRGTKVCAAYQHRAAWLSRHGAARNADRLWNRLVVYPKFARTLADQFDVFHVVDHSYSQLIHALRAHRTGVYCHDLDTFRCLIDPAAEPRPRWFRAMARRILTGMQKAAVVFHSTDVVREQIMRHGLIDTTRLVKAPFGVADVFRPSVVPIEDDHDLPAPVPRNRPFLLHVGSCIARKRIDVLLDVFAATARALPDLMLLKVGGEWTASQREQIDRHGIGAAIVHIEDAQPIEIAACYRHAKASLMTSEAEGFGFPLVEGLSCAGVVICSDIPVFREVGGDAVLYAPLANVPAWSDLIQHVIADPSIASSRENRLQRASQFSWHRHAATIAAAYSGLAS